MHLEMQFLLAPALSLAPAADATNLLRISESRHTDSLLTPV